MNTYKRGQTNTAKRKLGVTGGPTNDQYSTAQPNGQTASKERKDEKPPTPNLGADPPFNLTLVGSAEGPLEFRSPYDGEVFDFQEAQLICGMQLVEKVY